MPLGLGPQPFTIPTPIPCLTGITVQSLSLVGALSFLASVPFLLYGPDPLCWTWLLDSSLCIAYVGYLYPALGTGPHEPIFPLLRALSLPCLGYWANWPCLCPAWAMLGSPLPLIVPTQITGYHLQHKDRVVPYLNPPCIG